MGFVNRDQVLRATLAYEDVEVPAWGGTVRVMALSGMRRQAYLDAQFDDQGKLRDESRHEAVLVIFTAYTVVGETPQPLFTMDDLHVVADRDADALATISGVAKRICGFTKSAVKDAEKN